MKHILVTGSGGQLGQCLHLASKDNTALKVHWETSESLDITNQQELANYFKTHRLDYVVNCAAYTQVDQAELEQELAFKINATAVEYLAQLCHKHKVTLIHISTDYVFSGTAKDPYFEAHKTGPINIYGASKLAGEQAIKQVLNNYFIIRTSWLYSQFGKNFYKTIRTKLEAGESLSIVTDQVGTPTNANDLAAFIFQLILKPHTAYGTVHFSNTGSATWFDFAVAIAGLLPGIDPHKVVAIDHYATFAQRPAYSVLSKEKLKASFNTEPMHWKDSLAALIKTHL